MRTGFVHGFVNKPINKSYSYHGVKRVCPAQPDPGMFDDFLMNIETTKVYTIDAYLIEVNSAYLEGKIELIFGAGNCTVRGFEWGKTTKYGKEVHEYGSFGSGNYVLQITY